MTTTPINLFTSYVRLGADGEAFAAPRPFDVELADWHLMTFHAERDDDVHAGHWEVHPDADEVVTCLTGGLRLYFRPDGPGGAERAFTLTPGTAVVVPRGQWHRTELDGPSDLMSLTVPHGTHLTPRAA